MTKRSWRKPAARPQRSEAEVGGAGREERIPRPESGGRERGPGGGDDEADERRDREVARPAQRVSCSSGRKAGRETKSTRRWVSSQNGFFPECPQRQSLTVRPSAT